MKSLLQTFVFLALYLTLTSLSINAQDRPDLPDPLRFEEEIGSFEQWDAKNSAPDQAVLFVGSSSIRFWNTAEAFPGYPLINRGFGGSHITDVLFYYNRLIGRFDPSLIVFYCGENDIYSGQALQRVFDDYLELLNRISSDFPDTHFLYISIKPSSSRLEHSEKFAEFNRTVQEHNQSQTMLHYIDLANPLTKANNRPDDSLFMDDHLHLNEQGYDLWNDRLSGFLDVLATEGKIPVQNVE